MKKFIMVLCTVILCLTCTTVAFANFRASDQIDGYEIDISKKGNGNISIYFLVESNSNMDYLGAENIVIDRQSGENWIRVASYDRNDYGLSRKNAKRFENNVVFSGTSGVRYRVEVTIFAENASGYDSRTKTAFVTA